MRRSEYQTEPVEVWGARGGRSPRRKPVVGCRQAEDIEDSRRGLTPYLTAVSFASGPQAAFLHSFECASRGNDAFGLGMG